MVKVFLPARRMTDWRTALPTGLAMALTLMVLASDWCLAQTQPGTSSRPAAPTADKGKGAAPQDKDKAKVKAKSEPAGSDSPQDKGDEAPAEPPPDPSQTQKVAPVEVFKDPNAEELVDLKKFNPIRNRAAMPGDLEAVKVMAQSPAAPVDPTVIRRLAAGMVAQLTDTRNIQALIDPPPGLSATAPASQAIESATTNLLEPLFVARANKSNLFLTEYNKVLLRELAPLLKHHLVPRVQAMLILGQSGNPDALKLFIDEIKNDKQTVWVKLWAIRGITNIVKFNATPRLTAAQEIEAARTIADLLDKNKELPWPVQIRALEALANLRQGFVPAAPRGAEMAAAAIRLLADPKARPDVRAEAAHALGMMQITSAVPSYNFGLVAYLTGQLAAQIGDKVAASYSEKGVPINASRAEYLTSLLVGPVYQAFDGQPGIRDSGLLHNAAAAAGHTEIQKVLEQFAPVAKASLELVRAPTGQLKTRRQELEARVAALKDYLAKNAPANGHLVPTDEGFLNFGASASAESAPAKVAGAPGGK